MQKLLKTLIFLLIIALCKSSAAHPLHVTVSNIVISNDSIYIKIQFDGHDLEHALIDCYKQNFVFETLLTNMASQKMLSEYINENFVISIQNVDLEFKKWDFIIDDKKVIIEINESFDKSIGSISIKNTIFLNAHADIRNMLIISANNFEKGFEFNNVETKKTITLVE